MLSKLHQLKEEQEQGFTLIELLVVILIIGILAAIAIPAFLNQRKSAVDSSVQLDVTNAAKALETASIKAGAGVLDFDGGDAGVIVNSANVLILTPSTGSAFKTPITSPVSKGTSFFIEGNTRDGYVMTAKNAGGNQSSEAGGGFVYESKNGGLKNGTPNP